MPFICKKNNIKPYTKPIHAVKSQVTDTNSCQKSSHRPKYTNATAISNAAIRFIRPADETMRTANPVRYFANRTWHACDVTSNQRPSSHVSSHITGSPLRSSQFANYQTPALRSKQERLSTDTCLRRIFPGVLSVVRVKLTFPVTQGMKGDLKHLGVRGLAGGENGMILGLLLVFTQYQRVTDRQTDTPPVAQLSSTEMRKNTFNTNCV